MSQKSSFLQPAPFVSRALTPDSAVRGSRDIVRRGKTPMLDPAEARQLIDAIDITRSHGEVDSDQRSGRVRLRTTHSGDDHADCC
jgi:hypothetical protein